MSIKLNQVIRELREDHDNLRLLLDLLESESDTITVDDEPDFELLHDIMQYMTVYSDAVHHPKEDLVFGLIREHDAKSAKKLAKIGPDHAEIAELGIGRKFQRPTVFESHTVADNIRLALTGERSTLSALFGSRDRIADEDIDAVLDRVRLLGVRQQVAGDLSHGQKQWLEIAMLLAQDPKLLLVDEPVAGMTDAETEETAKLLRDIASTHSVVVVEHDMAFVRALDVRVTCLHEGAVIAEGSIDAVSNDKRVIEVYLGR